MGFSREVTRPRTSLLAQALQDLGKFPHLGVCAFLWTWAALCRGLCFLLVLMSQLCLREYSADFLTPDCSGSVGLGGPSE